MRILVIGMNGNLNMIIERKKMMKMKEIIMDGYKH